MKKKIVGIVIILALVVCLSLTLGLTSTIAYAYDGSDSSSSDGVVLGLSYSESESGHTATITLDSDVEIVNYQFQLVFDSAMITIESVAFNEVEGFITDSNAGNITITVAGSAVDSLLYGGVDLVYINFAVNSGVVLTDYSVFTLSSSYDNYMSIKTSDTESYSVGIIANFDAFSYGSAVALLGDANLDGIIDIADAVAVLQHTTGSKTLTGTALINADVNCDNVVDVNDATDIQRHIAGLIDLNGTTSGGDDVDTDVDGNVVYNITFNANSGYFSNNETIITQQSNNWTIETPQHSDATFSYWYYYTVIFNDDGTATEVVSIFDSSTTITSDITLYASWDYNTSGGSTDDDTDTSNTCEVYVWGGVVWETSLVGLNYESNYLTYGEEYTVTVYNESLELSDDCSFVFVINDDWDNKIYADSYTFIATDTYMTIGIYYVWIEPDIYTLNYYIDGELYRYETNYEIDEFYIYNYYNAPTGYYFDGWYSDESYSTKIYTIGEYVYLSGDTNIYGRLVKNDENSHDVYLNISYSDSADGNTSSDGTTTSSMIELIGAYSSISQETIEKYILSSREMYAIYGLQYYADSSFTTLYVFDSTLSCDTTIYVSFDGLNTLAVKAEYTYTWDYETDDGEIVTTTETWYSTKYIAYTDGSLTLEEVCDMFNVYYLYTDTAYEIAATESDMNSNYLQLYYKAVTSPQINYYIDGTLSKTSWDEGDYITLYQPTVGVNLIFDGWYLDEDCIIPASAKDIVDGENNLYGKFAKENESDSMVTVNISLGSVDWNSGEVEYEEYIAVAGAFNAETISSTALNQALVSSFYFYIEYIYYTDDTYTTLYNFDSELSGDITLYCKAIGHFIVIVVSEDGTVVDGNTDVQLAMIIQNEGQSYDDALAFYGLTLYELNDAGEKVLATELVHFGYYYFSETIFFDIEQEGTRVPVAAQAGATLEQALLCTMYLDVLENGAFYTDVTYTTVIDNNTVVTDGGVYYFDSY